MSVTTTSTHAPPSLLLRTLDDYALHHSGSNAPSDGTRAEHAAAGTAPPPNPRPELPQYEQGTEDATARSINPEVYEDYSTGLAPPGEEGDAETQGEGGTEGGAGRANPANWPSAHRRIPPHRPINYDLDRTQRPDGDNPIAWLFINTMLRGCAINAGVSQWWSLFSGVTGVGRDGRWFRYEVGGEW